MQQSTGKGGFWLDGTAIGSQSLGDGRYLKIVYPELILSKLDGVRKLVIRPDATTKERKELKPRRMTACSIEVISGPRR